MPPEKKHGHNPKEWPVSQSDGERLKVVYLVVAVDKEARGGGSLLVASLLEAAGSKEEEEEVK